MHPRLARAFPTRWRIWRPWTALLLGVWMVLPMRGRDLPPLLSLAHRQWLSEDGLPQDTVTGLVEGRDGFLWIGTEAGLVRFDGATFDLYSRASLAGFDHNEVTSLVEDRDGSLWIATSEPGLYRFHQGILQSFGPREGLPLQPIVQVLVDGQGTFWAAPAEGPLLRREGGRFVPLPTDAAQLRIRTLHAAPDGTLWVGTSGAGLWRVQEGKLALAALLGDDITALASGPEGALWVGTRGHGLRVLGEGRLEAPAWARGLPPRPITALLADPGGSLWIGLDQAGLFRHPVTGVLESAAPVLGVHWTPRSLLVDRSGALWAGSEDRGLRVLYSVPFQTLPVTSANPEEPAWMVCQDAGGTVWCLAGEQTLGRVVKGRVEPVRDLGAAGHPTALWPRKAGGLWIGTREGRLCSWQDGRLRVVPWKELPQADSIVALYEDPDQALWVSTSRRGLIRMAPGRPPTIYPTVQGVHGFSGGGPTPLYFASRTLGLGLLEEGQVRWFGKPEGLGSHGATSLLPSTEAGCLWVGTVDGLRYFRDGRFLGFGTRVPALLQAIHALLRDESGNLWVSTNQGVCQVSEPALLKALEGAASLHVVVFDHHDGMASRETSGGPQPAAWAARGGVLYFPTGRGLTRRDPAFEAPPAPPLRIHFLKSESDETVLPESLPVRVPAGTHRFEVYYTATSPTRADKVRFRYRLDGWEQGWNDVGDRRFSAYSNLPPGRYRFIVQAWRTDVSGHPQERSIPIEVLPFLYQRPLFWGAAVAVALAFVVWLIRLRMQQIEARTAVLAERNRMAREIHDHLAQGFTGVLLQLEAAEAKLGKLDGDPQPVLTRLDHARSLATASLQEARRSVMVLRPRRPEGTDLLGALRMLSDRLLAGTGIQVELAVTGEPRALKPRLEDELLRMAQELLTNALRHGKARWVRAVLQFDGRWVRLSIEDDGRGFDPKADAAGYGMRSIREGVRSLGGHLDIDSTPGFGSRITLNLPTRRWFP